MGGIPGYPRRCVRPSAYRTFGAGTRSDADDAVLRSTVANLVEREPGYRAAYGETACSVRTVYHALCAAIEEEMFGELRVKSGELRV